MHIDHKKNVSNKPSNVIPPFSASQVPEATSMYHPRNKKKASVNQTSMCFQTFVPRFYTYIVCEPPEPTKNLSVQRFSKRLLLQKRKVHPTSRIVWNRPYPTLARRASKASSTEWWNAPVDLSWSPSTIVMCGSSTGSGAKLCNDDTIPMNKGGV